MRKTLILVTAISAALAWAPAFALGSGGGHSSGGHSSGSHSSSRHPGGSPGVHTIRGYTQKNGTYVSPYHATNPNRTQPDNFSSKGNVNPYTGKAGTKNVDK